MHLNNNEKYVLQNNQISDEVSFILTSLVLNILKSHNKIVIIYRIIEYINFKCKSLHNCHNFPCVGRHL